MELRGSPCACGGIKTNLTEVGGEATAGAEAEAAGRIPGRHPKGRECLPGQEKEVMESGRGGPPLQRPACPSSSGLQRGMRRTARGGDREG